MSNYFILLDELIAMNENNLFLFHKGKFDVILRINNNDAKVIKILYSLLQELENIENFIKTNNNNLEWLNLVITKCGFPLEPSLTKARKFIKKRLYINIFDLCKGDYYNKSKKEFKRDLTENPKRRFPLLLAKVKGTKEFLKTINKY